MLFIQYYATIYCANIIMERNVTLQTTTDCGLLSLPVLTSQIRFLFHATHIYHDGDDANYDNAWGLIQGIILGFL